MTVDEMDFSVTDRLFQISPAGAAQPVYEMPASEWLLPIKAEEGLRKAEELYKATGMELPASFAGLTMFNLVFTRLMLLAGYDRLLDLSLDNLVFQMEIRNDFPYLGYRIREIRWLDVPENGRDDLMHEAWSDYFRNQVHPVIRSIADIAGVKPDMIWNQFGGNLAGMTEYLRQYHSNGAFLERLGRDSAVLTERLSPDVFDRRRNPFVHTPRYVDNPWQPGGRLMMRSSCCMYDCREGGQKCYTCPRMTPEERERVRESVSAQAVK